MDEIAHLSISAPIIIGVVNLLTICETYMHIIGFCTNVPPVLQHGKLKAGTEIIG